MNRRQLRGEPMRHECDLAHTIREGADVVCGGLHKDSESFFLSDYDVIDMCRACKAWHGNYSKGRDAGNGKHHADKSVESTSVKTIKCAREKPRGVSDVRWRIELRRRASPEYYNQLGNVCK